jgi:hypothetical protein
MSTPRKRYALCLVAQVLLFFGAIGSASANNANEPAGTHFPADTAALYERASQVAPPAGTDVILLEDEEVFVIDAEGRVVRTR